jgi:adenylosuccinate synthase
MIGTTKKGIGPAYTDKASREGIRIIDMYDDELFFNLIKENVERKNLLFKAGGKPEMNAEEIYEEYKGYREEIKKYVTDTSVLIYNE